MCRRHYYFFFNDTATTEIYTLSLHDALPIYDYKKDDVVLITVLHNKTGLKAQKELKVVDTAYVDTISLGKVELSKERSEEHTSELQSRQYLVCRLLLEKKNNIQTSSSH